MQSLEIVLKTFKAVIPLDWVRYARYVGKYDDFCGDWIYSLSEDTDAVAV
jgi:hypothetical protein